MFEYPSEINLNKNRRLFEYIYFRFPVHDIFTAYFKGGRKLYGNKFLNDFKAVSTSPIHIASKNMLYLIDLL